LQTVVLIAILQKILLLLASFEHIIPLSAGGKTRFENLCFACPTCNRYKAMRQMALDLVTGETVSLFHPHKQLWAEHFTWTEDTTQMMGLTPTGRATISTLKMNRPQLIRVRQMWAKLGKFPPSFDHSYL
jgi:hypothetical protein